MSQTQNTQALHSTLRRFHRQFGDSFEQFQSAEQQDVHEFLSCLLLSSNDDINLAPKFNQPIDSRLLNADQSKVGKAKFFQKMQKELIERDQSSISDLFQSIIGDCITCNSCKKPKYKFESELILSVPIEKVTNNKTSKIKQ